MKITKKYSSMLVILGAFISKPIVAQANEQRASLDTQLRTLITEQHLTGNPTQGMDIPSPEDPEVKLGKLLFFSKSLSGDKDVACASCHHPYLGGGDALALPIGTNATLDDVLGVGREPSDGQYPIPRNSPTVFNSWTYMRSMFRDSRVELVDFSDSSKGINTPDVALGEADPNAGGSLLAAQARFPVTSVEEMRGSVFEAGQSNDAVREHLAARIGDFGIGKGELYNNQWRRYFEAVYKEDFKAGKETVTFANISRAIGQYQRSMNFTNNRWYDYIKGDLSALTDSEKRGAILFFTVPAPPAPGEPPTPPENMAACAACHGGDSLVGNIDLELHRVGFPQIGVGTGGGVSGTNDLGRGGHTGVSDRDFEFRSSTLLNIDVTAPFGHTGSYQTLEEVVRHYNDFHAESAAYIERKGWCEQPQFKNRADCESLFPDAEVNTTEAVDRLANTFPGLPKLNLNEQQLTDLVAFLKTLTDPCVTNAACLQPWLPQPEEGDPDRLLLHAKAATEIPLYVPRECKEDSATSYQSLSFDQQECISGSYHAFYVDVDTNETTLYISTVSGNGEPSIYYHPTTWATKRNATRSSVADRVSKTLVVTVNQGRHYFSVASTEAYSDVGVVVSIDSAVRDPLETPPHITNVCENNPPQMYAELTIGQQICLTADTAWLYFNVTDSSQSFELRTQHGAGQVNIYTDYQWPSSDWYQFKSDKSGSAQYLRLDGLQLGWYFIQVEAEQEGSVIQLVTR